MMVSKCEALSWVVDTDGSLIVDDGEQRYYRIRLLNFNNNIRVDNHLTF
jgi:hypothetical protein